jgi:ribonuclease D
MKTPDVHLLTTAAQVQDALPRLGVLPRVAVDCESNGMHAWRGRVCVIQLATAETDTRAGEVFLIDALALDDLACLGAFLGSGGPVKVFHDAGFDARILRREGVALGRVLDTAVHARFLGARETGLAAMLDARFGVKLDKRYQHHDWARRPLDPGVIEYLVGDVIDLGRLAASLEEDSRARDIAEEIAEETAYMNDNALRDAEEDDHHARRPPWTRIKGARELGAVGRAVLRELAGVRDAVAQEKDVPPGRVVSNSALVTAARARPRSVAEVRKATGVTDDAALKALVAAVARGVERGDVPADERAWLAHEPAPRDLSARRDRERALSSWRAAEAEQRGVDLQVVLPGHCLADLAARGARSHDDLRAVAGFGEVRVRRYGDALVGLLAEVDSGA